MNTERANADDLRATVVRDREHRDAWRVEKMDEDGGYECVEVFAGPTARSGRSIMPDTALASSTKSSWSRMPIRRRLGADRFPALC
jgi:hypothetical protein